MGVGPDRAGDGAGGDLLARGNEPRAGAYEFGIGVSELEPEGGWLGMHAVAPADRQRVLMLQRARLQRRKQAIDIGDEQVRGLDKLKIETGVEHVRRGHAPMQETRFGPDRLGDRR